MISHLHALSYGGYFHCTRRNGCRQQVQIIVTLSARAGIYAMMGSAAAQIARWMAFHEKYRSSDRIFSGRYGLGFCPFQLFRLPGSAGVCRSGTNDSAEQSVRHNRIGNADGRGNIRDDYTVAVTFIVTNSITDSITDDVADSSSDACTDTGAIAIADHSSRADRFQRTLGCIPDRP